jgi:branched-chain amino acid transport system substrate-binding protein
MTIRGMRRSVIALTASVALLSGCGGSAIEGAGDPAAAQADTAAAVTDTPAGSDVVTAPDAAVPDTSAPGAGAPAAGATDGAATPAKGGTTTTPGKPDAGKAGGGGTAKTTTTGMSAVEKLVATAPIFGGNGPCKPATLSPVAIGNVSTLSGVIGELMSPVRAGLETFAASQNACGGLNGHKIELFIGDDQGDPTTASSKMQELIQKHKIMAFIGNIQVLTVDAIAPVVKKYGIPVIGSDLTSNTWFTNPLLFPMGSGIQSTAYGYLNAAVNHFKVKNVGQMWCLEVPRACEQHDRAFRELAPMMGATVKKTTQVSITAPSYVQQCLDMKNAGVEALGLTFDAASQHRVARSCTQVGFFPKIMPYPLGVGNEKQFLQGNKWLGDAYVSMNHFPWFMDDTPALKYWHASIKKFNPGFTNGGAAVMGWSSGALLVAASAGLSAENPTTQQLLETLWTFKGQKWTTLGGLTPPLTFRENGNPSVPYCLWTGISNPENTGWASGTSKPSCTNLLAPSDPQKLLVGKP